MPQELSDTEIDTYSRQIVLRDIGYEGQARIRRSRVCVVGVGGLGSTIVTQLAGMGVGLIRIVDRDIVERANIHRQCIFDVNSIGMAKVEAAEKRIREINPDVDVEALPLSINDFNIEQVVKGMDIVLDGLDSFSARRIVNRACVKLGVPYVFGSAMEMFGNVSTIILGETPCLDCFLPRREPSATCATVGVHPSLVSIIASIEVSEAIKIITGREPSLKSRLLFLDLRNMFLETVEIRRSDSCETCGQSKASSEKEEGEEFYVEEACSTRGLSYYIVSPNTVFELNLNQELPVEYAKVKARHRLSTVFLLDDKVEIHLLKSGVGIIRGAKNKLDALQNYMRVFNLLNR
jgi:adenylyltransferase/sulfurtransferase